MFSLLPINLLVRQVREIPEFQLKRRGFGGTDHTTIIRVFYPFAAAKIDLGQRKPGGSIEYGEDAVAELFRLLEVYRVTT